MSLKIEHWKVVCEYIADYDGQLRDLKEFIRKGDKIRLTRKQETEDASTVLSKDTQKSPH